MLQLPRRTSALLFISVAVVLLSSSDKHLLVNARAYSAPIVGGHPTIDEEFDKIIGYKIFAEAGGIIAPSPLIELHDIFSGVKRNLADPYDPAAPLPPSSISRSRTLQVEKLTRVKWYVTSAPLGAPPAVGPTEFVANRDSQIVMEGLRFDAPGTYHVLFNVSIFDGEMAHFNKTIVVQRQPERLALIEQPYGNNGTIWDPYPRVEFTDFRGQAVKTDQPRVYIDLEATLQDGRSIVGTLLGTLSKNPNQKGVTHFDDIIAPVPALYTFRIRAILSDGTTLNTPSIRVTVDRALPTNIIVHQGFAGMAGFQLFQDPLFSIVDSRGPSFDNRMNMSLSIVTGGPSVQYVDITDGTLLGISAVPNVDYYYRFNQLAFSLPGRYGVRASLVLPGQGGSTVSAGVLFVELPATISEPPTWELPAPLTVNTIGTITLYGQRPDVDPIFIKFSTQSDCSVTASDIVPFPRTTNNAEINNISIVPFQDKTLYPCMSVLNRGYSPLIQRYLQRFNEARPRVLTFSVAGVDKCQPLSAVDAAYYKIAGWTDATEGRRYGCKLTPPASGTIPPCTCPDVYSCEDYTHGSFKTPVNLNIGRCVCCVTWVLAVSSVVGAIFFIGLLFVIIWWV